MVPPGDWSRRCRGQVFSDYVSQSLTGGVDFGTKDIGSGYNDDATCEFKDMEIRDSGA